MKPRTGLSDNPRVLRLRVGAADPAKVTWRTWSRTLLFVLPTVVVYACLPEGSSLTVKVPLFVICLIAVAVGGWAAAWRSGEAGRRWFMSGTTLWMLGDLIYGTIQPDADHLPLLFNLLFLIGYGCVGLGCLKISHAARKRRELPALLDAALVSVGMVAPTWVFLVPWQLIPEHSGRVATLIAAAYPVADMFLLVLLLGLGGSWRRFPVLPVLVASMALWVVVDLMWAYGLLYQGITLPPGWQTGLRQVGYLGMAIAMSLPGPPVEAGRGRPRRPVVWRQLIPIVLGLLLPGFTLFLDGHDDRISWRVLALLSVIVAVLAVLRFAGLLGHLAEQTRELAAMARHDALTGLANRWAWDDALADACAAADSAQAEVSLALLDLDHFKRFNDTFGHEAGDRLLAEAATAWSALVHPGDLLARIGGEEFALLLPGRDARAATQIVQHLLDATPRGRTCSAGIATRRSGTWPREAMRDADRALYQAKAAGRAQLVHADVAGVQRGEIPAIVVQPIVATADGRTVGYEALSRFTRDRRPDSVFTLAHGQGYGDLLEATAIVTALQVPDRPGDTDLYVNASLQAMGSDRFMAELPEDLSGVVVEVSETGVPGDWQVHRSRLALLRSRGARIALDDWGIGADDLARLTAVQPDIVKIHASIVAGCHRDRGRRATLSMIVTIAAASGALVCAEGVEYQADYDTLRDLGVTLAQGFHLGRPHTGWTHAVPAQAVG